MTSWHSYPKVWNLGHAAVKEIFDGPFVIEEKIDGSQFSFGKFGSELKCRSSGKEIDLNYPEKLFDLAIVTCKRLFEQLQDGWTYRAEYLSKPKHNVLAYGRVPKDHLILFDISFGEEQYLTPQEKKEEANRLGLECVPQILQDVWDIPKEIESILNYCSCLGREKIEGIVFKNYGKFGPDKKVLMAKYVSPQFKEVHATEWKKMNPGQGDILSTLVQKYQTEARWQKALQHLKETGQLQDAPQDIGKLIPEIRRDCLAECKSEVMEELFQWAWPQIERGIVRGAPEWYKKKLLEKQFEGLDS